MGQQELGALLLITKNRDGERRPTLGVPPVGVRPEHFSCDRLVARLRRRRVDGLMISQQEAAEFYMSVLRGQMQARAAALVARGVRRAPRPLLVCRGERHDLVQQLLELRHVTRRRRPHHLLPQHVARVRLPLRRGLEALLESELHLFLPLLQEALRLLFVPRFQHGARRVVRRDVEGPLEVAVRD